MENLKAVIYIRVSDESQIKNNSLDTQLKACMNFAEANGLEVIKTFRDEGVSAKHIHTRPEMRELLKFCSTKKNNISRVIVYKMDRWTRNVEEGLVAMNLLAKYGVAVVPATEVADQTPMGRAMRTILMALGELDNGLKSERTRDNMQTLFKSGVWCWKPPIGYLRPNESKEERKGKPPVKDKRLADAIRLLYVRAAEMKYTKKYLSTYLNTIGFKEYYGKDADGRLVAQIISNPFYYGNMYSPRWKLYSWGNHEPIIDNQTWEQANMNTFGNKRKYKTQESVTFPLKGMLLCGNCLHPQTSSNPKGRSKNYLYYECHQKDCPRHERLDINDAHKQFISILSAIKPSKRVLKLFSSLVFEEWDNSIRIVKREAELIEEKVKRLEDRLISIAEANSKGILSDDEAKNQAEKVRQEITVLKIEGSDYKIEEYDTEAVKSFTESFLGNLDKFWMSLDLPEKQELQKKIFPKGIICKKKKIRTAGLSSSFELIEALNTQNFNLVTLMHLISNRF